MDHLILQMGQLHRAQGHRAGVRRDVSERKKLYSEAPQTQTGLCLSLLMQMSC